MMRGASFFSVETPPGVVGVRALTGELEVACPCVFMATSLS